MAVFVTNPRRRRRARRTNGAVNALVAKKIGVNIRTAEGRSAVKAFKRTPAYAAWLKSAAKAVATERTAKKSRTAASKAYTKKTGKSRAAEFYASVSKTAAAAAASTSSTASAGKRGGSRAGGRAAPAGSAEAMRLFRSGQASSLKEAWAMVKGGGKKAAGKKVSAATAAKGGGRRAGGRAAPAGSAEAMRLFRSGQASSLKEAWAMVKGGKRKASSRRKNPYGFFRRTNGAAQDALSFVKENALSVRGLTALALAGAAGAAHFYLAPKLDEQVTKLPVVGAYLGMAPYTLTGILAGALVYGVGAAVGAQQYTNKIAAAAVLGGPVLDVMDYLRSGGSEMTSSDKSGVVYNGIAYNGVEVMSNPSYGGVMAVTNPGYGAAQDEHAIVLEYGDAQESDAYVSGEDFDEEEGDAIMRGPRAFFRRFGPPPRIASRKIGAYSRHAGRQGHRWGWLIKLVGFRRAQEIAALPPEERLRVIASLREQAIRSLPALMSRQAALPAPAVSPYSAMMADAGAMGAGGASAYGAVVYAGAGY